MAFSLEPAVRARFAAEAKTAGMELGHDLQKVLENHLLESAAGDDEPAARIRATRAVIDRIIELATGPDTGGQFDEHFVPTVMKAAAGDKGFMEDYQAAIAGEGKKAAHAQKPLNQQLGRLIRKSVGAKGMRTEAGRVDRAQVTGEIITSYTLLTKQA